MTKFSPEEQKIKDEADNWAKANKKRIAKEVLAAGQNDFDFVDSHIAVFMSGSPAAGKTEVAQELAAVVTKDSVDPIIRLDPDEYREMVPNYMGSKSYLYQGASSQILNKCFDVVTKAKQTFIFDSTLSDLDKARSNIQRCLNKEYDIRILYVYQDAMTAWDAAQKREIDCGRRVPMEAFIDRYFGSRATVNELKKEFGKSIKIDLLLKDIKTGKRGFEFNVDNIDNHLPESYNPVTLKARILETL